MHHPSDYEDPRPGASGIQALDGVIGVQGIEEQEPGLLVVLWGAHGVH